MLQDVLVTIPATVEDKQISFEQYKLLLESINTLNNIREQSNNFWIVVNSMTISAVAFVREALPLKSDYKVVIVATILSVGFLLCYTWLSYLASIKEEIFLRQEILMSLEKQFPNQIFSSIIKKIKRRSVGSESLTYNEMFVPGIFLVGYLIFVLLLLMAPQDMLSSTAAN
jgi:hypothetical protein